MQHPGMNGVDGQGAKELFYQESYYYRVFLTNFSFSCPGEEGVGFTKSVSEATTYDNWKGGKRDLIMPLDAMLQCFFSCLPVL